MHKEIWVHGVCPHDCYDTCSLEVLAEDGQIKRIKGQVGHPITRGFLCFKVNRYLERINHPDRVLYPLRRTGPKGSGQFVRVTWEQALDDIADRLQFIVAHSGAKAILPYSFAGNMGVLSEASMDRRFFNAIGASQLDRTICTASASAVLGRMFGQRMGPDPETLPKARMILLWGTNPMATNVHQIPLLDEARQNGAQIWTVDPLKTETANRYQYHVQLKPNSDAVLAMALGRYLIDRELYDHDFVARHASGFDQYRAAVKPWSLGAAAHQCGVDPALIEQLALNLATVRPLLIRPGFGMQRQQNSGLAVWAVAALSVLTGSFNDVAGGLLLSNGDAFGLNWNRLTCPDLAKTAPRIVNMVQLGQALETFGIEALVVYNANPAATAPDQSSVIRGLSRDSLFVVVHEQMMTDTAQYADYVLPAAMSMEILDLHVSYWHRYVQLNMPATNPAGEAVSNTEFFRRLAHAMGLTDPALHESDETLIAAALDTDHPYLDGITLESLYRDPVQKLRISASLRPYVDTPIMTSDHRLHLEPVGELKVGHDVPGRYHFITPSRRETIKSSFANLRTLEQRSPYPELLVNPEDAQREGWLEGQWVRVHNDRGEADLKVCISSIPAPGTVVSYAVRWNRAGEGANINQLTSQELSDFGGGATFYSTRVDIEKKGW